MNKIFITYLVFTTSYGFSYYNERLYEGNPIWEKVDTVQGRLDVVKQFIPEEAMIFEVGAFDGSDSLKLATHWPLGKIISFEANPAQFAKYQIKAANFPNMSGYNLAVNTYNGTADFYLCWGTGGTDPVFEGASSLLPASESMKIHYMGPVTTVPCVILDEWCKDNGISNFDFMWLDLEGFELPFLKSSPQILSTVKVVYTETNFYKFREGTTQYGDLKSFLESEGFIMIAQWYNEGLQGDAIFVRNELVD